MTVIANEDGTRTVLHGAYGRHTPYDVKQHRYACTDCEAPVQGYRELLEIADAPPGRARFVIHDFRHDVGARGWEFPMHLDAFAGWDALMSKAHELEHQHFLPLLPASSFAEFPGLDAPWFYKTPT